MRQGPTLALLLALAAQAADEPPLPDSRLGFRTAPLLLLSRPDVRADLKLSPAQTASAEKAIRSFYVRAHALLGKENSPEVKRERRAIDDEVFGWIDTRLLSEQKVRLAQLDLQWEGPSSLVTRASVTRDLNLSREQIDTLVNAVKLRNESHAKGHADANKILAGTALECLTSAQREAWKAMMGDPLAFSLAVREEPKSAKR